MQAGEEEVAGWLGRKNLLAFLERKKLQCRSCNGDLEELQDGGGRKIWRSSRMGRKKREAKATYCGEPLRVTVAR